MTTTSQDNQGLFPIRELSARTQVNTITLRAWERRYGLLKPTRTPKGHRLYSDADVAVVEKTLALVARGVPLGKVKPLLQDDTLELEPVDESANWQTEVDKIVAAAVAFASSKVEHLLREAFGNYPAPVCRERLLEPAFTALAKHSEAASGFAQSELIRYTAVRLSAKVASKKGSPSIALIAGTHTPLWRLALMAIELSDNEFTVHLINNPLNTNAALELANNSADTYALIYQDGVWKDGEQALVADALAQNPHLFVVGTAAALAALPAPQQVFADAAACINGVTTVAATTGDH